MKMKLIHIVILIIVCLLSFAVPNNSKADMIVDTGDYVIPESSPVITIGLALNETQWLAGEFHLNSDTKLTKIRGLFSSGQGDSITLSLYTDSQYASIPNSSQIVHRESFSIVPSGESLFWSGISDLNIFLESGTYWVAFEIWPDNNYQGGMPMNLVPSPLENYSMGFVTQDFIDSAYYGIISDPPKPMLLPYQINSTLNFGLKIEGSPVPLPGAIWLLGFGLAGLAGVKGKMKQ